VKAVVINQFGGPEQLKLADIPVPVPAPGEVLLKLEYAGINFTDVYQRNGHYARSHTYQTPLPMTIGMEGAGTVVGLGAGVSAPEMGARAAYCAVRGSYAQFAVVPAWKAVNIPDSLSLPVATTLMLQGFTAHYLSHSAFALGPQHTCLVHAGAGGVGQLLIQMAKLRGATVLATVGSKPKAEIARQRGADHVILYRETDFREEVMKLTGGTGVDVVYDAVGKDTIAGSIRSLKRRGLCVNYGGASGLVQAIEPLELAEAGSVFFTRPHLADYIASAGEINQRASDLFAAYGAGKLAVTIDREYPLADAAAAHTYLEAGKSRGKLLLNVLERSQ
jgi:NADPH2:quinone reductase